MLKYGKGSFVETVVFVQFFFYFCYLCILSIFLSPLLSKKGGVLCVYVFAQVRCASNIVEQSGINGCLNHMFIMFMFYFG